MKQAGTNSLVPPYTLEQVPRRRSAHLGSGRRLMSTISGLHMDEPVTSRQQLHSSAGSPTNLLDSGAHMDQPPSTTWRRFHGKSPSADEIEVLAEHTRTTQEAPRGVVCTRGAQERDGLELLAEHTLHHVSICVPLGLESPQRTPQSSLLLVIGLTPSTSGAHIKGKVKDPIRQISTHWPEHTKRRLRY